MARFETTPERLEFREVNVGDQLEVTTGQAAEAWRYSVIFDAVGKHWPHGQMQATNPKGEQTEVFGLELHGCGKWTTKKQNPVQERYGLMFTPYYDGLIVGEFMWGRFDGAPDRQSFDKPGQEISRLLHAPYRENFVLGALAAYARPLRLKELQQEDLTLTGKDIRSTLAKLTALGHVRLLQQHVQRFELIEQA